MSKKIIVFMVSLSIFAVAFVSAQTIDIKIIGEEGNSGFNFLLLDVKADGIPDRTTVRAICNFLQRNYIILGFDPDTIQEIDDNQFTTDLGFGEWRGGHPIYEYWYGLNLNWHCLQNNGYFYVMKGMWPDVFYKVKIKG
ncbi:MAG: hypothetical protein LBD37_03395 [Treponema sp.]|jgi:hypothetical protein|nr:hypothetical protein [Treponema sp.]